MRLSEARILDDNVRTNKATAAPIQPLKIGISYDLLHSKINLMSVAS
jgi:hypothetical protein